MSLVDHARTELEAAGLFDKDSDYDGMIGESVMKLIEAFADQGHSGFSAEMTLFIFNRVANFKSLGPITTNPNEWQDLYGMSDTPLWQNRRQSSCFSRDGGKTYYDLNDPVPWYRRMFRRWGGRWTRLAPTKKAISS